MNKKTITLAIVTAIFFGVGGFFAGNLFATPSADAEEHQCVVDESLLARIYSTVFHRPLDKGAKFHLNKDIDVVLNDVESSEEQELYGALFEALKAYEEAIRAEGELSEEDKEKYLDMIDQALAQVVAWAEELPEQPSEDRVIGPERARQAIFEAYSRMNATARENARGGLMRALQNLDSPEELPLPGDYDISLTVETSAATSVGENSAVLNGELVSLENASEASVYFRWREAESGDWNETEAEVVTETGVFSTTVDGLNAATQYEFRARAESGAVASESGDTLTFTTEEEAVVSLTAATSAATSVTDSSAVLNGELEILENATDANVYFEWKASSDTSWNMTTAETVSATGVFSATLDSLTAETQYDFRAVAESDGVTSTGGTLNFTTEASADTTS